MEKIYKGVAKKREVIPAVFHADDTCRIQTVTRTNELFYELIQSFYQKTGVLFCSTLLSILIMSQ